MCSVTPESLSGKAADFSVCKQKYLLVKNNGNIICFVEGKYDVDYYLGHFRHHFGEYFELLECKNKKNVLKAYDTFYSSDHSNVKMGFFVDRDFDDNLYNMPIYVTDVYLIENYYCSVEAVKRILKYALKIQEESEINDALSYYESCANDFHHTVAEFNSFYSVIKKKQREADCSYKVCLKDTFPNELATIEIGNCRKSYTLSTLLNKYSLPQTLMTQKEVDDESVILLSRNPFCSFRGKYELEFVIKFLTKIVNEANKKNPTSIVKQKISATINKVCFMSDYAQYADVPNSLKDYLDKVKQGI